MAVHAFLAQLPSDSLSPDEQDILELLEGLGEKLQYFLPKAVSLQDWAENRCPDDKVDIVNATGVVYISRKSSLVARPPVAPPLDHCLSPTKKGTTQRMPIQDSQNESLEPTTQEDRMDGLVPADVSAIQQSNDAFFRALPEEEFLPEEESLRNAIRAVLRRACRAKRQGGSHYMSNIESLPNVANLVEQILPNRVKLLEWVERRMGAEIEVFKDTSNHGAIVLKTARKSQEQKDKEFSNFFSSLPQERYTDDELILRDCLLGFLKRWTDYRSPKLTEAGLDADVADAKKALLPEFVGLAAWIDARMGDEIELMQLESGQFIFGLPGSLKVTSDTDKRYRYGNEHDGGKGKARCKRESKKREYWSDVGESWGEVPNPRSWKERRW
eukprot:TRINITY_DN89316_c0_g1_i1.p1 TRINITY_DN89316_c0_g1~~TRINITY_DN89316_c0_g1_i1.p1  ORF type:complete len:385 (-),score=65.69 TRINITY_DN89316_c0_g1_i1:346-1500(-)